MTIRIDHSFYSCLKTIFCLLTIGGVECVCDVFENDTNFLSIMVFLAYDILIAERFLLLELVFNGKNVVLLGRNTFSFKHRTSIVLFIFIFLRVCFYDSLGICLVYLLEPVVFLPLSPLSQVNKTLKLNKRKHLRPRLVSPTLRS